MKDEFFALTLTGAGALFGSGVIFAACLGSALKGEWETVTVLAVMLFCLLSAVRSDARLDIRDGRYRGRLFRVRTGDSEYSYENLPTRATAPKETVLHGEVLQ